MEAQGTRWSVGHPGWATFSILIDLLDFEYLIALYIHTFTYSSVRCIGTSRVSSKQHTINKGAFLPGAFDSLVFFYSNLKLVGDNRT
jgi:hypothetical protein